MREEDKIGTLEKEADMLELLFGKARTYTQTSYEILKLKTLDKTSGIASSFISRLYFIAALFIFIIVLNIGIALWLGEILGKSYYGFFLEAAFYSLVAVVLFFMHTRIKQHVGNAIIKQVLN